LTPATVSASIAGMHLTAGVWFHGVIGTITTTDLSAKASDFTVSMDWGPGGGEDRALSVVPAGTAGTFYVVGSHCYHTDRLEPVTLGVTSAGQSVQASTDLNVASSAITFSPGLDLQSLRDEAT